MRDNYYSLASEAVRDEYIYFDENAIAQEFAIRVRYKYNNDSVADQGARNANTTKRTERIKFTQAGETIKLQNLRALRNSTLTTEKLINPPT